MSGLYARRYAAGDARLIDVQARQLVDLAAFTPAEIDAAAAQGLAYTIVRDGAIIACGGLLPLWSGFAKAWGLATALDARAGAAIIRQIRAAIGELAGARRIEATARKDFPEAQMFLAHAGFEPIALLRGYAPDGGDCWLFEYLTGAAA